MFDYKSLMKAGLDESSAKAYMEKIKTTKIGSNIGIRMTEETLFQKLDFYDREIGFSVLEVLDNPFLLTYDTTDENSPTSVITKIKFLKDTLSLTASDFKNEGYKLFSMSIDTIKEKIKFLKTYLDFDADTIKQDLSLLIFRQEYITEKAEYYKKLLGFTNAQFKKYPSLFVLDIDLVNQKLDYLINTLGMNESQLRTFPKLLSLDYTSSEDVPTSVRAKVKFYHDTLGFGKTQFQKAPCLIQYDCNSDESNPTSIRSKIKYYKEVLGLTDAHFRKHPGLFGYDCQESSNSPTSVPAKIAFYKQACELSEADIKDNLILLHLDTSNEASESSVLTKLKALREIGITDEEIRKNTQLLLTPAQDIKDKYVLWCKIFPDKSFMKLRTWFITRAEKVYARYKYLSSKQFLENVHKKTERFGEYKMLPNHLDMSESLFQSRFKVESQALMLRYPLDEEALTKIYEEYSLLGIEPPVKND